MKNQFPQKILELNDVENIQVDYAILSFLSFETAQTIETVPFEREGNTLALITTNNKPEQLQSFLTALQEKGYMHDLYYTDSEGLQRGLQRYQELADKQAQEQQQITTSNQATGDTALGLVKQILEKRSGLDPEKFISELVRLVFQAGASDLHFQPEAKGVFLRARIDGVLQTLESFDHQEFMPYMQKLKFIAGVKMNIDYVPQDGRFSFVAKNGEEERTIDVRVNFMPGIQSESSVLRFLDSSQSLKSFEELGFRGNTYDILQKNISKSYGMIIISGPTGSGKTTTLYSILNSLNDGKRKIITLEDPIEYKLPGIQQSQINYAKDYDYAKGLKACLRHDPDVILVGETRTLETAEIAINAALTGHLVFTTLHTNSAIESITRLVSMGIKPYMLGPSLLMIQGQRLVRKICPHCMTKKAPSFAQKTQLEQAIKKVQEARPDLNINYDGTIPIATGCEQCNGTGYKGRITVLENLDLTEDIKELISSGATTLDIYAKARQNGFLTLQEDAYIKMLQGLTSFEEVRKIL